MIYFMLKPNGVAEPKICALTTGVELRGYVIDRAQMQMVNGHRVFVLEFINGDQGFVSCENGAFAVLNGEQEHTNV